MYYMYTLLTNPFKKQINALNEKPVFLSFTDEQKPTISNCPANITVDTDPGSNGATVTWTEPSASDNSGSVTLLPNIASGSVFSIGYTDVLYTADDLSGNEEQCSFVVEVIGG